MDVGLKVGSSIALARQWPGNRMNFSQDRTDTAERFRISGSP